MTLQVADVLMINNVILSVIDVLCCVAFCWLTFVICYKCCTSLSILNCGLVQPVCIVTENPLDLYFVVVFGITILVTDTSR